MARQHRLQALTISAASQLQAAANEGSLCYYIALAFVGGLILNLMPCVLPVIGLKVMSFVEQSGKSRAHAFMLNLWFAAGIISVFLLLGLLAATLGLTWGGQFGNTSFNVTIAAVVFAMALSLLGVWEVPIPGFFGSGSVQSAAAKEGPLGAFFKGVVTTVLATPCTAPLMAAAIAWAVTQPIATKLVVFATRRPRHGQPVLADWRLSRAAAVPAKARRVDGNIQTNQRLRAAGHRRVHPFVHRASRDRADDLAAPGHRRRLLASRPHAADRRAWCAAQGLGVCRRRGVVVRRCFVWLAVSPRNRTGRQELATVLARAAEASRRR